MFRQKLLWKTLDNVYLGGLFQSWKQQYFTCSVKEHQLQVQVLIKLNYDSLIKHVLLDLALDPLRSSFQFEDQNLWQRKLLDSGWWMCDLSSLWSHQGHAVLVNVNVLTSSDLHRITMFTFAKDFFNDFFFTLKKRFQFAAPCRITSWSFDICREKTVNCWTQTHTETRMEFTQRNEAVPTHWKQTTTGDREERERHTDRGIIWFLGWFFLVPLPHPFLSPHLVGLDSSLQVLDPFVSLGSRATRKALGSWCRSHLRLQISTTTAFSHYGDRDSGANTVWCTHSHPSRRGPLMERWCKRSQSPAANWAGSDAHFHTLCPLHSKCIHEVQFRTLCFLFSTLDTWPLSVTMVPQRECQSWISVKIHGKMMLCYMMRLTYVLLIFYFSIYS